MAIYMDGSSLESSPLTDFPAHCAFPYAIMSFWLQIFLVMENSEKVCGFLKPFISKSIFILHGL